MDRPPFADYRGDSFHFVASKPDVRVLRPLPRRLTGGSLTSRVTLYRSKCFRNRESTRSNRECTRVRRFNNWSRGMKTRLSSDCA